MRCISWNVNGLRAVLKKDFETIFETFDADLFALQETKLQAGQVELDFEGYHQYWSYAEKKGYAGTAVFSKQIPLRVLHGIGLPYLDSEGRVVALEFDSFWFVNVYTPNAQNELARIDPRLEWDATFRDFCKGLEEGVLPEGIEIECPAGDSGAADAQSAGKPKPVVMCGDFNVAHNEIDLKNPSSNRGNAGFSDEERESFTKLLDAGFVDTFRSQHPDLEEAYSWWSYRFKARERNAGWRIDYFLVSEELMPRVESSSIYSEVLGSDHCPIGLEFE